MSDVRERIPRWAHFTMAAVGFLWLVGGLLYLLYLRVTLGELGPGTRLSLAGMCLAGLGFAFSAIWPTGAKGTVSSVAVDDFWAFVRSPPPEGEADLAVWRKLRRTLSFLLAIVLFMFTGLVANWSGY